MTIRADPSAGARLPTTDRGLAAGTLRSSREDCRVRSRAGGSGRDRVDSRWAARINDGAVERECAAADEETLVEVVEFRLEGDLTDVVQRRIEAEESKGVGLGSRGWVSGPPEPTEN